MKDIEYSDGIKHIDFVYRGKLRQKYHEILCKRYCKAILSDLGGNISPEKISILDVGCGRGEVLNEFYCGGFRKLYAIDINNECVKRVSSIAIAFQGNVNEIASIFPNKQFDYIILTGVLEHIPEPIPLLRKLEKLHRRGVLISVPNMNYLTHTLLTYLKGPIKINQGHLYGWDVSTLENLLKNHIGFRDLKYFSDTVFLPGRLLRKILSVFCVHDWLQFKFLPGLSPFLGALLIVLCKSNNNYPN
jgi:SAM-dependent methyltransferase